MKDFDTLIQEAEQAHFSGWDFSWLRERWNEADPPWDYRSLVLKYSPAAQAMLDMGTGGGEFLARLPARPAQTFATEAYPPNLPIARARLEPLGIPVSTIESDDALPYPDGAFDLVINRHESYSPREVGRILRPGGVFLTQQVGGSDNVRLNELIIHGEPHPYADWTLRSARAGLETAGFAILRAEEAFPPTQFLDIGALVYYLRAIPWQIENFSAEAFRPQMEQIHALILRDGYLQTNSHRFLLIAQKPA